MKQCYLVEQTPGAYSQLPADHPASASTRGESWRYFLQGVHHQGYARFSINPFVAARLPDSPGHFFLHTVWVHDEDIASTDPAAAATAPVKYVRQQLELALPAGTDPAFCYNAPVTGAAASYPDHRCLRDSCFEQYQATDTSFLQFMDAQGNTVTSLPSLALRWDDPALEFRVGAYEQARAFVVAQVGDSSAFCEAPALLPALHFEIAPGAAPHVVTLDPKELAQALRAHDADTHYVSGPSSFRLAFQTVDTGTGAQAGMPLKTYFGPELLAVPPAAPEATCLDVSLLDPAGNPLTPDATAAAGAPPAFSVTAADYS